MGVGPPCLSPVCPAFPSSARRSTQKKPRATLHHYHCKHDKVNPPSGVCTLIVFLPEPAWAAREYRDKQKSSTSVYTTGQTRLFAPSSILLRHLRATSTAEKSGPSI